MRNSTLLRQFACGFAFITILLNCASLAYGQNAKEYEPYLRAKAEDMTWWRDAKFGMFIHWGPCTMVGTEISWSRKGERGSIPDNGIIPQHVYDNLYKGFDPYKFNAREWVALAKAAGQKYIVFTAKHHDGFCMWDTSTTDYNITNSPFKRDIVAELAEACHEAGLKFGLYYSVPDWYHPDHCRPEHARYVKYMMDQVRELLTKYGRVDIMWFDCERPVSDPKTYDTYNLYKLIRTLQPGIILNDRGGGLPGDFITPERTIGGFRITPDWESCMSMGEQWAWKPSANQMSAKECILTLIRCAGGNGNLLLNISPMPNGQIEQVQADTLKAIGDWIGKNGESIYGTRGGPFMPSPWISSTHKGNTIYVHILDWDGNDPMRLSQLPKKIVSSRVLAGGRVDVKQGPQGIEIRVPEGDRNDLDTVVTLTLNGQASDISPLVPHCSGSVAFGKTVTASSTLPDNIPVSIGSAFAGLTHSPANAVDDDYRTIWVGDGSKLPLTLEVDIGSPTLIDSALLSSIDTPDRHWISKFELQYKDGGQWRTIRQGNQIGYKCLMKFSPVKAIFFRLVVSAVGGDGHPGIREFQLFTPKG
ncbi:MAG: alpha-L-fucosidase [Armatimonadetes bacterium]|nr:alpha-L-fucosidase [Armatimonadota bacterium]